MKRGQLRIYLGAAPGVGKTYAMLDEGYRRRRRGTDVVIGFVETYGRPATEAQIRDLPIVPRKRIAYRDRLLEEMDLEAILARAPAVVLVDELAHTNVPGAGNEKRWQDVQALLDADITVISTLNIQHLESFNDVVERITGAAQRETIPDSVVRAADQVELVDMTSEALRRRMAHGNVYPPEKVDTALANYFRPGNLDALRTLALRWVAGQVDEELASYRERHDISELWETGERIVVAFAGAPGEENLIRRASRMGARLGARVVGVHVRTAEGLIQAQPPALESQRQLLAELGCASAEVSGADIASALLGYARAENATQLVVGASRRPRWRQLLRPPGINRVVRDSSPIDVHVISLAPTQAGGLPSSPRRYRPASVPPRRRLTGWVLGTAGIALYGFAISPLQSTFGLPGALLCLLLGIVSVAAIGGVPPAAAATVIAALVADYFFTPPVGSLRIAHAADAVALVVFFAVAGLVSALVDRLIRRDLEMARARAESEALARLAGRVAPLSAQRLPTLVAELRGTFALDMAAVLVPEEGSWRALAVSGGPVPDEPQQAPFSAQLDERAVLVFAGEALSAEDSRLLQAFVAQLRQAQEEMALARQAATASALAEANSLRTALLAAVSHDLRTPLHAIKTAATSLLSDDVSFSPEQTRELCETIDSETDRLTALVENLLDMSRLQAGVLPVSLCATVVEDVLHAALASLPAAGSEVVLDLAERLPAVQADAGLLERAVANVLANAERFSPPAASVRVLAGVARGHVEVRVIDRGPGIAREQREQLFQPFQRLGDHAGRHAGLGLGLAIARGFVEAMGGELTLEDTPGGGATFVFSLPVADVEAVDIPEPIACVP
ncbi:MAG TPA: ATP-binding protein [Solirubrobacteraceae bacterium]|nr:ATP-binding protein [Solirubrobacteraceae bacterium]